jgi:hypothetical protein
MKLYRTSSGFTLRTHDNRVYDIINGRAVYRMTSAEFVINGVLLREIPNNVKSICFKLNKKPKQLLQK